MPSDIKVSQPQQQISQLDSSETINHFQAYQLPKQEYLSTLAAFERSTKYSGTNSPPQRSQSPQPRSGSGMKVFRQRLNTRRPKEVAVMSPPLSAEKADNESPMLLTEALVGELEASSVASRGRESGLTDSHEIESGPRSENRKESLLHARREGLRHLKILNNASTPQQGPEAQETKLFRATRKSSTSNVATQFSKAALAPSASRPRTGSGAARLKTKQDESEPGVAFATPDAMIYDDDPASKTTYDDPTLALLREWTTVEDRDLQRLVATGVSN